MTDVNLLSKHIETNKSKIIQIIYAGWIVIPTGGGDSQLEQWDLNGNSPIHEVRMTLENIVYQQVNINLLGWYSSV